MVRVVVGIPAASRRLLLALLESGVVRQVELSPNNEAEPYSLDSGSLNALPRTMNQVAIEEMVQVLVGIPAGFRRLLLALLELGVAVSEK